MFTIISIFQKLIKGGVGIKVEGFKKNSKINKRGDDYSVLESSQSLNSYLSLKPSTVSATV